MDLHIDALSGGKVDPANLGLADILNLFHFVGSSPVSPVVTQVHTLLKFVIIGVLRTLENDGVSSQAIL